MVQLETPSPFGPDNLPYDAVGGEARVRELINTFFEGLASNPAFAAARATYPEDLTGPHEKLYMFITGWLGGPQLYIEKFGHPRLRGRHAEFAIGETQRDQWLACMGAAMDTLKLDGELRTFLDSRFAQVADFMRNK